MLCPTCLEETSEADVVVYDGEKICQWCAEYFVNKEAEHELDCLHADQDKEMEF